MIRALGVHNYLFRAHRPMIPCLRILDDIQILDIKILEGWLLSGKASNLWPLDIRVCLFEIIRFL